MFVLQEHRHLARIGLPQEFERRWRVHRHDSIDQGVRPLQTHRPRQHFPGVFDAANGEIAVDDRHLVCLVEHLMHFFLVETRHRRDLDGDRLDLVFLEVLENLGRIVRPERHQEGSCLRRPLQALRLLAWSCRRLRRHRSLLLVQPGTHHMRDGCRVLLREFLEFPERRRRPGRFLECRFARATEPGCSTRRHARCCRTAR
ncbi:hypothetical protein HRbin27_01573 [bacterium HR27]|nr:hypothetical protein HRbin27_01573 [bacterium HR27]